MGGGHGGAGHLDIEASQAQVEDRHTRSCNMDSGLAVVAACPQLIILVGGPHSQDDAVVHGGGVVGHLVRVRAFVSSRGHKQGSVSLGRINGSLQATQDWSVLVVG